MKRFASLVFAALLLTMTFVPRAEAAGTRVIVRVQGGLPVLQSICVLLNCTVNYGLGDPDGHGGWVLRAYYNPLVPWIWFGALVMAAGGALSLADRRLRIGAPARRSAAVKAGVVS